ncbi:MAG: flippase [Patescibacteria group bacterium]
MEIKSLLFENTSPRQIVFKNIFWLYFSNIISKFFKFFLVVYAARILGPASYGAFNYALYLVGIFFMFSDLGIGPLLTREYQKEEVDKNKLISTSLILRTILVLVAAIVAIFFYFFVQDPLVKTIYIVLLLMMIVSNGREFFIALSRANNKMEYESSASMLEVALTTILGLFFLVKTGSLYYFALAYLIGSLASFLYMFFMTLQYIPRITFFGFDTAKKMIILSTPFAFGAIIGTLLGTTDVVMIKWLRNAEMVGQYSVGLKIIQLLFVVVGVFATTLYPIFSKFAEDKDRVARILKSSSSYILMLAIPLFFGGILLSDRLIVGFFGEQYQYGVLAFKILMGMIPIYFMITILDVLLLAMNYQVKNMIYTAIAAVSNVVLCFFLIAKFSIYGAAAATIIAQLINLSLTYRLSRKILNQGFIEISAILKYIIAGILMAIFLFLINPIQISTFAIMLLAVILYFLILAIEREKNFIYLFEILKKTTK